MHEHGKGRVDKQGVGGWEPAADLERPDDAYFGLVARSVKRELPDGLLDFQWEVVERHCARGFLKTVGSWETAGHQRELGVYERRFPGVESSWALGMTVNTYQYSNPV